MEANKTALSPVYLQPRISERAESGCVARVCLILQAACALWSPAVSPNSGRAQRCCWGELVQTEAPCDRQQCLHPEQPRGTAGQAWAVGAGAGLAEQGTTQQTCAGFESQLWGSGGWRCDRITVGFSSVAQSCPTLCDPTDCSTPGLPVHQNMCSIPGSS